MSVIAYAGEEIKSRDGKVIATLAQDITSGDLNIRPNQFVMEGGDTGAFLPEEVYQFVRDKLSNPSPEPEDRGDLRVRARQAETRVKAEATPKAKQASPKTKPCK